MHKILPGTAVHSQFSVQSEYKKTRLPNGIRIVTESLPHVRSISVGAWIDVGSRDENESNNGISHFIEHMVFKGTEKFSSQQIARSIESVGGYLNAFTTKEHTCYYARILDDHIEKALEVLSELVQHPEFDPKEIEKERGVILEELKNIEDDPDDLIHDYLDANVYYKHPLGFPIIGKEKNIRSFKRNQLQSYIERHYIPQHIVVAAAGNVNHDAFVELVQKYFSLRDRKKTAGKRSLVSNRVNAKKFTYEKPITQAHICLGTIGYSVQSNHRYPLLVLNSLLGEGMSSRLFQNIRERYGFAYSVFSFANLLSDTGSFGMYIGTDNKHIDKSLSLMYRELEKLREKPIGAAELKRTKAQLKGTTMLSLESMSNRMMRLGSGELYFGQYLSLDEILRSIDEVQIDDVSNVAHKLLNPEKFSTVIFTAQKDQSTSMSAQLARA